MQAVGIDRNCGASPSPSPPTSVPSTDFWAMQPSSSTTSLLSDLIFLASSWVSSFGHGSDPPKTLGAAARPPGKTTDSIVTFLPDSGGNSTSAPRVHSAFSQFHAPNTEVAPPPAPPPAGFAANPPAEVSHVVGVPFEGSVGVSVSVPHDTVGTFNPSATIFNS